MVRVLRGIAGVVSIPIGPSPSVTVRVSFFLRFPVSFLHAPTPPSPASTCPLCRCSCTKVTRSAPEVCCRDFTFFHRRRTVTRQRRHDRTASRGPVCWPRPLHPPKRAELDVSSVPPSSALPDTPAGLPTLRVWAKVSSRCAGASFSIVADEERPSTIPFFWVSQLQALQIRRTAFALHHRSLFAPPNINSIHFSSRVFQQAYSFQRRLHPSGLTHLSSRRVSPTPARLRCNRAHCRRPPIKGCISPHRILKGRPLPGGPSTPRPLGTLT